jgi:hypothetical protein
VDGFFLASRKGAQNAEDPASRVFHKSPQPVDESLRRGMWTAVEKLRLREVFHHLLIPPRAANVLARVMTENARVFQLSMSYSSHDGGGQRRGDSITLLGDKQEF